MFEPDNPRNAGAMVRLAACLDLPLAIVEPCGFTFTLRQVRSAALDYGGMADVDRHDSWPAFEAWRQSRGLRLVLLSTRAGLPHHAFRFAAGDVLMVGRESSGVPGHVHAAADAAVRVPMRPGARSLNVLAAAAMVAGEALRQTRWQAAGEGV